MTYDHWKTTNPADEWLSPEPDQDRYEYEMAVQSVAMSVKAIRDGIDDLNKLNAVMSDQDTAELDLARFDLEQLLMKVRFPILQQAAD